MTNEEALRPNTPEQARVAWDEWVASEVTRHEGKDHEFEPDRDFDEDDVEGHMPRCAKC